MVGKKSDASYSPVELARLSGVSTDTLRHYERVGVIPKPSRGLNGYRRYDRQTVVRLQMIRAALTTGFTLRELAEIFGMRSAGGIPCHRVQSLAQAKLAEVEKQLRELRSLREKLRRLVGEWEKRMSQVPRGRRAKLLESLPTENQPAPRPARAFTTTNQPKKRKI